MSYWLLLQCSFPGAWPLWTETLARLHQWAKTPGFDETPWEECSKLLVDWVLGPMGGNVGKSCGCCDVPVRPGTLTTATVSPNIPQHSAQGQSTGNRGNHQGGVNRHLMLQPPKQPGPDLSSLGAMAPEDDHNTDSLVWRLGMVSKRVGVMSTPGRTDMLMKPTRVTHQALCQTKDSISWSVFAHLGPLQAEALQQLASVGKTSRFWG